jgi:hypothetical protein
MKEVNKNEKNQNGGQENLRRLREKSGGQFGKNDRR